jgi:hypothetical protein
MTLLPGIYVNASFLIVCKAKREHDGNVKRERVIVMIFNDTHDIRWEGGNDLASHDDARSQCWAPTISY